MTYSYVGGLGGQGSSFTYTPTTGNLLVVFVRTSVGSGSPISTAYIKDSNNSQWFVANATAQWNTTNYYGTAFYLPNCLGGSTTFTLSFNGATPPSEVTSCIVEYSGIATAAPLTASSLYVTPSTGTDTASAPTINNNFPTALVLSAWLDNAANTTVQAGTGYTRRLGGTITVVEDARLTSAGSVTPTWSPVTSGDAAGLFTLVFAETASPLLVASNISNYTPDGSNNCNVAVTCALHDSLLIYVIVSAASAPLTISGGGNTYVADSANPMNESNNGVYVYYWRVADNQTANPTVVIHEGGGTNVAAIGWVSLRNANSSNLVDDRNYVVTTTTDTSYFSDPVTQSLSNDVIIAWVTDAQGSGVAYAVSGNGYTRIQSSANVGSFDSALAMARAGIPGVGVTNPNWNSSTSNSGVSITTAISGIAPTISTQPKNQSAPSGSTVTFSVSASISTGGGSLSYQWYKNGAYISAANSSSYTTPALTSTDDGATYYCAITDNNGTSYTATVYSFILAAPQYRKSSWYKA